MAVGSTEPQPCWLKTLDFICAGVGIFMVVIGVLKYVNSFDNLTLGQFVTNFYAICLGLLVASSALGWSALVSTGAIAKHQFNPLQL